jgi:hypothetical protein
MDEASLEFVAQHEYCAAAQHFCALAKAAIA